MVVTTEADKQAAIRHLREEREKQAQQLFDRGAIPQQGYYRYNKFIPTASGMATQTTYQTTTNAVPQYTYSPNYPYYKYP